MNFGEWQVAIIERPGWDGSRIYLYKREGANSVFVKSDGIAITHQEGDPHTDDDYFCDMTREQIQALADGLAKAGVRTTNDAKNEGLLQAKQDHLEDMRRLVFKGKAS